MVRAADRKEAGLDAPGDVPDDAMWHGRRRYHGRREEVLTDLTSADRDMDEMGGGVLRGLEGQAWLNEVMR